MTVPLILLCIAVIIVTIPAFPSPYGWAAFALALIALLIVVVGWPRVGHAADVQPATPLSSCYGPPPFCPYPSQPQCICYGYSCRFQCVLPR